MTNLIQASYNNTDSLIKERCGRVMRNYQRFYNNTCTGKSDKDYVKNNAGTSQGETRSKVIIDDNSIYEIDLDCYERKMKKRS